MKTMLLCNLQFVTAGIFWGAFAYAHSPWYLGVAVYATLSAIHMALKDAATLAKH